MDPGPTGARTVAELYAAHVRRLLRLATLLLGDPAPAEDAVHDVFTTLHHRPERLDGVDDVAAYLRRSVVNAARSARRRQVTVLRHRARAADPTAAASYAPAADADLLVADRRRAVLDALGSLPRRQREVLALRHYLELSEREIAETLGISQGAVKTHASRGAAALRTRLSPHLQETR